MRAHGPFSGQAFREDVLFPMFEKYEELTIDLSGAKGFGSSFLDESFGEFAKQVGLKLTREFLRLTCEDDPFLVELILEKMEKAASK